MGVGEGERGREREREGGRERERDLHLSVFHTGFEAGRGGGIKHIHMYTVQVQHK